MFSKDIIGTDAFLEMPTSSQLLYFHLGMEADDDGFVGSPKKISRMIGCGDDDLKVLVAKRFILSFPKGIVVIKHWKMNNYIQKDRYHETKYLKEKSMIMVKKNGSYTECIQNVNKMDTEVRLGKARQGKNIYMSDFSKNSSSIISSDKKLLFKKEKPKIPFQTFWDLYDKKIDKVWCKKRWEQTKLSEQKKILEYIPIYKKNTPNKKYRKNPKTFFNAKSWEDEETKKDKIIW